MPGGDLSGKALARALAYYDIAERVLLGRDEPSGAYLTSLGQRPVETDPVTGERTIKVLPGNHLVMAGILAHPLSRGSVHIRSADNLDAPVIDPYLTHPVDIEVLAEHMLYLQGLASRGPLAELLRQPATASQPLSDLAGAAGRYVRLRAMLMWHPAGTCTMLPRRKRGIVDSSVVPLLPPGTCCPQSTASRRRPPS